MTTFSFPTQIIRFRDIESSSGTILSVRPGTLNAFVNNPKATFSYRADPGDPGDNWPDVTIRYPRETIVTLDSKHRLDLDENEAFLGRVTYDGRKSTFLLLEEELSGNRYDSYLIHIGGATLPVLNTVGQVNDFLENAVLSRITSGSFAPGRDIAFSSLPGRKVTEHDRIIGDNDSEALSGGRGNDVILGLGGHDTLIGGDGHDRLLGGGGNDRLLGGAGKDSLEGGAGHDVLEGGADRDQLLGGAGNDRLLGGTGMDILKGGTGRDTLQGGAGQDQLTGGSGADVFVFRSIKDSVTGTNRDVITDFRIGDRIDLSGLDADRLRAGNQDLDFTGMTADDNAVWYVKRKDAVIVRIDNDGDGRADFEIMLAGVTRLTEGDFIL